MLIEKDNHDRSDCINGTILIVTENTDVNTVLAGTFELNGFKCLKCNTAEEALNALEKYKEEADSMLLDGKIAEDRGAKIIVKSRIIKESIKIVVVASHDNAKTRVLDYGADDFVLKPISAEALTNKVITQLVRR